MSLPLTLMRMPYTQHRATANSLKDFRSRSVKHNMYAKQCRMASIPQVLRAEQLQEAMLYQTGKLHLLLSGSNVYSAQKTWQT